MARPKSGQDRRKFALSLFREICTVADVYNRNISGKGIGSAKTGQVNQVKILAIRQTCFTYYPAAPSDVRDAWNAASRAIDKANWQFHKYLKKSFDLSLLPL